MTSEENDILKKLIEELRVTGISPIADIGFLLERISARIERKKLMDSNFIKRAFSTEIEFSSPVCFAKSDEVQPDYRDISKALQQIDSYIDRLILMKGL